MIDNKLIANFMSFNAWKVNSIKLKYHQSWDWLMPVIEKIESLGQSFTIDDLGCHMTQARGPMKGKRSAIIYSTIQDGTKIECVYKAVVDFIKWYNKENKL